MIKKYVRIQGREIAYQTGQPRGIFAMCWRMIYDGIFSEEDAEKFKSIDQWFKENLLEPDLYSNNNPQGVITFFKTATSKEMLDRIQPACELLDKYKHPYDLVYTDYVGLILYEDEFQIAVKEERRIC